MICRIADFTIEFINPTNSFKSLLNEYEFDAIPEISFSVTKDDIKRVQSVVRTPLNDLQAEGTAFYEKFLSWLPLNNALFFHSSLIEVANEGIAFTALSGTGKSTHTLLWQRLLGDKMQIINGDKPIIRFFPDGVPYAYGTPWRGKEGLGKNTKTKLRHICFIERSKQNSCEMITAEESLKGIFNQIFIPREPIAAAHTLELINRVLNACTIWKIKCNMDISAAEVAYNTIFGGKKNEA